MDHLENVEREENPDLWESEDLSDHLALLDLPEPKAQREKRATKEIKEIRDSLVCLVCKVFLVLQVNRENLVHLAHLDPKGCEESMEAEERWECLERMECLATPVHLVHEDQQETMDALDLLDHLDHLAHPDDQEMHPHGDPTGSLDPRDQTHFSETSHAQRQLPPKPKTRRIGRMHSRPLHACRMKSNNTRTQPAAVPLLLAPARTSLCQTRPSKMDCTGSILMEEVPLTPLKYTAI